jgi:arylformamidase
MKIFDISRTLSDETPPWPGDTPFKFELKWKMAEGASVNVGAINMSVHNGTHADAPFHFDQDGASIERMPLDIYFGDAVVLDLTKLFAKAGDGLERSRQITIADLKDALDAVELAPRLLLKTNVWNDSKVFPDWIPVIAPDVAGWLGEHGVKLLGLDLPSVDPIEAKNLTNHHALAAAGIAILESLDLRDVASGTYHFSALPLKIAGSDAGPVRAILWRD